MSNLPGGPVSKFVQDKVISLLWYDLPHPPATYIADEYRHADGSGNNPHFPNLGKAGSSYSRNVQSTTAMPESEQPDPALVFDSLLRREAFVEHPAGNSSLMFGSVSTQLLVVLSLLMHFKLASPRSSSITASELIMQTTRRTRQVPMLTCPPSMAMTRPVWTVFAIKQVEGCSITTSSRKIAFSSCLPPLLLF